MDSKKELIWSAYKEFSDRISDLKLFQYTADEQFQNEMRGLQNLIDSDLKNNREPLPKSAHMMMFYCAETGGARKYGARRLYAKDYELQLFVSKNKQYQWLLVDVYESFEVFISNLYSISGFLDNDLWLLSDYGSETFSSIKSKPIDFYKQKCANKKDRPQSIMTQYRLLFTEVKKIEKNNAYKIDFVLVFALIENLRNIIVHKNGRVDDKDKFIERVLKRCCLYNGGKYKPEIKAYIEHHFGKDEYQNMILLLELQHPTDLPIQIKTDRLNNLINVIMAYSYYLSEQVDKHITKPSTRCL